MSHQLCKVLLVPGPVLIGIFINHEALLASKRMHQLVDNDQVKIVRVDDKCG